MRKKNIWWRCDWLPCFCGGLEMEAIFSWQAFVQLFCLQCYFKAVSESNSVTDIDFLAATLS